MVAESFGSHIFILWKVKIMSERSINIIDKSVFVPNRLDTAMPSKTNSSGTNSASCGQAAKKSNLSDGCSDCSFEFKAIATEIDNLNSVLDEALALLPIPKLDNKRLIKYQEPKLAEEFSAIIDNNNLAMLDKKLANLELLQAKNDQIRESNNNLMLQLVNLTISDQKLNIVKAEEILVKAGALHQKSCEYTKLLNESGVSLSLLDQKYTNFATNNKAIKEFSKSIKLACKGQSTLELFKQANPELVKNTLNENDFNSQIASYKSFFNTDDTSASSKAFNSSPDLAVSKDSINQDYPQSKYTTSHLSSSSNSQSVFYQNLPYANLTIAILALSLLIMENNYNAAAVTAENADGMNEVLASVSGLTSFLTSLNTFYIADLSQLNFDETKDDDDKKATSPKINFDQSETQKFAGKAGYIMKRSGDKNTLYLDEKDIPESMRPFFKSSTESDTAGKLMITSSAINMSINYVSELVGKFLPGSSGVNSIASIYKGAAEVSSEIQGFIDGLNQINNELSQKVSTLSTNVQTDSESAKSALDPFNSWLNYLNSFWQKV